jgi:hypothetical protein
LTPHRGKPIFVCFCQKIADNAQVKPTAFCIPYPRPQFTDGMKTELPKITKQSSALITGNDYPA